MEFTKTLVSQSISALIGANGKETFFGVIFATIGTSFVTSLGGWGGALKLLLFLMVFDYATGLLSGIKDNNLNSDIMFWGAIRKIIVLGVIIGAGLVDTYAIERGMLDNPVIQTGSFYFYIGREILSNFENLGKLNILIPDNWKAKLAQVKSTQKQGDNNG